MMNSNHRSLNVLSVRIDLVGSFRGVILGLSWGTFGVHFEPLVMFRSNLRHSYVLKVILDLAGYFCGVNWRSIRWTLSVLLGVQEKI